MVAHLAIDVRCVSVPRAEDGYHLAWRVALLHIPSVHLVGKDWSIVIYICHPDRHQCRGRKSEGFPEDTVDFNEYNAPVSGKFGSSESIIAGMVAGISSKGYKVGGFDAYTTSNVMKGSGLSSSAAFEVFVGTVLNFIFNEAFYPLVVLSVYQLLAMIPVVVSYMRKAEYSSFIRDLANVSTMKDIFDKTFEVFSIFFTLIKFFTPGI